MAAVGIVRVAVKDEAMAVVATAVVSMVVERVTARDTVAATVPASARMAGMGMAMDRGVASQCSHPRRETVLY